MSDSLKSFISISLQSTQQRNTLISENYTGWAAPVQLLLFSDTKSELFSPPDKLIFRDWSLGQHYSPGAPLVRESQFKTISTLHWTLPGSCLCGEHLLGSGWWSSVEPDIIIVTVLHLTYRSPQPGMPWYEVPSCSHQQTWPTQSILRPTANSEL